MEGWGVVTLSQTWNELGGEEEGEGRYEKLIFECFLSSFSVFFCF